MGHPDAIKYELGLTIIGLVVFWVWQTLSLRRDMRKTAEDEAARAREAAARAASDTHPPTEAARQDRDGAEPDR